MSFIDNLNTSLQSLEAEQLTDVDVQYPLIFVNGLPRSGTTLLMQSLTTALKIGYVNNLMARFWNCPLSGYSLSKEVGIQFNESDFSNSFGRTKHVFEPHEFSYFWKKQLLVKSGQTYDYTSASVNIHWDHLIKILRNLQHKAEGAFLFKGLHPCRHLENFSRAFENLIVIHIHRDEIDVARSLKKARLHHFGNAQNWWSMPSSNYDVIKDLPYHQQIPRQLLSISQDYEENYRFLASEQLIRVEFDQFLKNPRSLILSISRRLNEMGFHADCEVNKVPGNFESPKLNEVDEKMDEETRNCFQR